MSTNGRMPSNVAEEQSDDLVLFAELKPRLSVVHTVLHIPRIRYERGTIIKVRKTHIEVIHKAKDSSATGDVIKTIALEDVSLIPASCHGLKWVPGDGMHFRMQICRQGEGEESLIMPNGLKAKCAEDRLEPFKASPVISCKMCGQAIVHRSFSRVRSLPSDDWHELSDQMFCHPHSNDVPDCHVLTPARGDCLVSDRHVVMRSEDDLVGCLTRGANRSLHCQRCKIAIGKQLELGHVTCIQLSRHYLSVGPEQPLDAPRDKLSRTQRLELWFADFLLTETSVHNSCRLLIEAETDSAKTSPYILLWVLESNVVLYSGEAAFESAEVLRLAPQPILKVLYRDCVREKNKGFGKVWREDFTVHALKLPHDLCKQMLLMLIDSSKLLPRSFQSANGFYVGFLRKKEKP